MLFAIQQENTKERDESLEKLKELGGKISDLTLKGLFFGKNGALRLEKDRLKITKNIGYFGWSWYGAISSTYYAASGNAVSVAKNNSLFLKLLWYWCAWRCFKKSLKISNKFSKFYGPPAMSLGELDVRACILNKAGRRNEAAGLLSHGIMKILTGQLGTKHDLCLFLIHEAEVIVWMRKYDKENKVEKNYQQAMKLTEDGTVPILTMIRVMKSYGKFLTDINRNYEAKQLLNRAYFLAEENKLNDQAVKIKALLAGIK